MEVIKMKRSFYVAGVQFRPRTEIDAAAKEMKVGDKLLLTPEPTNKFDPNAVRIEFVQQAFGVVAFLGYVPKKFSSEVSAMLGIGASVICTVDEVNSSAKTYEMFKVTVSIPVNEPIEEDDATYEQHLEEEKR
jgi:hypothetical protein